MVNTDINNRDEKTGFIKIAPRVDGRFVNVSGEVIIHDENWIANIYLYELILNLDLILYFYFLVLI